MQVIKCKMCGGNIDITPGKTFGTCEYCGSTTTLPKLKDNYFLAAFNRGNSFRRAKEFDKALAVYEQIIQEDDSSAEAHWCCALCRFGIEYVEDPLTYEWIPTCNRASFNNFLEDVDYLAAVKYSEGVTKRQYQKDGLKIADVQKRILAASQNEEPFDIFICYKELDENGNRTQDSVWAQDIYYQLIEEGYRVFFSRITLEDKGGAEYEPYIFAALNSAKVMIAIGSKPEYFNAVWVKNEWSRFLALMRKDKNKRLLPCYRDMDPNCLPEALSILQSYDMSKIGFVQDLLHGVKKVISKENPKSEIQETTAQMSIYATNVTALLKRGYIALEDAEWNNADNFFEEVLNRDAECAEAYLGKLMAEEHKSNLTSLLRAFKNQYRKYDNERLEACPRNVEHIGRQVGKYSVSDYLEDDVIRKQYDFDRGYHSALSCRKAQKEKQKSEIETNKLLNRARQYAEGSIKEELENGLADIMQTLDTRIQQAEIEDRKSIEKITAAYDSHIVQADKKVLELYHQALDSRDKKYQSCVAEMNAASDISAYEKAKHSLNSMKGYKDTAELAKQCQKEIERLYIERQQRRELAKKEEEKRRELAIKEEAERKAKKKKKMIRKISTLLAACITFAVILTQVIIPQIKYNNAVNEYNKAVATFGEETVSEIQALQVGDVYTFGTYEQDNDESNGTEDIEWIVVKKKSNGLGMALVSKYALYCVRYNDKTTNVTWENSRLYRWLNNSFYDAAFDEKQRSMISDADGCKVFLLSTKEAEEFFASNRERQCEATAFAKANGAEASEFNEYYWWWLQTPGTDSSASFARAAYVRDTGAIYSDGKLVDTSGGAVRPAMWINLAS